MFAVIATVALFLLILSALVLIHELGHFFAARIFGVKVEEFGIGFPPRATSFMWGETRYSINWLPLGGFVRLKGEQGGGAPDTDSFASQPVWKKVVILSAGAFMNLALAVLIFTFSFSVGMPQAVDDNDTSARDRRIEITSVLPNSPADLSGMKPGDIITTLDSQPFIFVSAVQQYVRDHAGIPVVVGLTRGEERVQITATPTRIKESGKPGFGIALMGIGTIAYPPHVAFVKAVQITGVMAYTIVSTLVNAVKNLAFDGFMGPVGIAATTATVTKLGFSYLLNLIAQLSLSLAIFNFLPIPALDGGRALFALLEKTRGRSLEPAIENAIHLGGFLLLIILLIMVTIRDVTNLFAV